MEDRSPYGMCSKEECDKRGNEVSIFEATADTVHIRPRIPDPCRVISKYRRSAAGITRSPPRSPESLNMAMNALMDVLTTQATAAPDPASLWDAAHFFEDRVRAIQVDCTISQYFSKYLAARMIRGQLMILYLLRESPKYQRKFGVEALQAAWSQYWSDPSSSTSDDEMLALQVLFTFGQSYALDDDTLGSSLLLTIQHQLKTPRSESHLVQWSLSILTAANLGLYQTALRMIHAPDNLPEHFIILARTCLPLTWLRYKVIQVSNVSLRKGEFLSSTELGRILFLSEDASKSLATDFGLPVSDDGIQFKAVPIESFEKDPFARDDAFVLGTGMSFRVDEQGTMVPQSDLLRRVVDPGGAYE